MFAVMELQYTEANGLATIVTAYQSSNEAEQKYHQILSAAAISNIDTHSAVLMREDGQVIKCESYKHNQ